MYVATTKVKMMVIDDTKWFASRKRFYEEWAPVKDEMSRVNAPVVRSEYENSVNEDIIKWAESMQEIWKALGLNPHPESQYAIDAYWNERLNS